MSSLKEFGANFGWPRIIIFLFLVALFFAAPTVGVRVDASLPPPLGDRAKTIAGFTEPSER